MNFIFIYFVCGGFRTKTRAVWVARCPAGLPIGVPYISYKHALQLAFDTPTWHTRYTHVHNTSSLPVLPHSLLSGNLIDSPGLCFGRVRCGGWRCSCMDMHGRRQLPPAGAARSQSAAGFVVGAGAAPSLSKRCSQGRCCYRGARDWFSQKCLPDIRRNWSRACLPGYKYCNPGNFSKLINLVNWWFWRFISY